ncbi:MAG: hypothetical protein JWN04_6703 [Myxococcaceae bacterium]|nr:hypothetical protein [Myxococcaceae bacterium]
MTLTLSDALADPLVMGVLYGDRPAWFQLTLAVEQWVLEHAPRHWRMRRARLDQSPDDVRDVLLATLERIDRDDFAVLRRYLAQKRSSVPDLHTEPPAELTFVAWLGGLVDFAIREHVRKRYGRVSARRKDEPDWEQRAPSKRSLQSWALHPTDSSSHASLAPGMTQLLTARSIMEYAQKAFAARELQLFQSYLEQASFEELAADFQLPSAEAARAEIRRLKERLRARFRADQ